MLFNVRQRGRKEETEWRKARLIQAVSFYARTLRIPHPRELDIKLLMSARKNLVNTDERGNVSPMLESLIDGRPHQFEMEIQRDMPWTWTLQTFAHEMVHIWQYTTGRLRIKWSREQGTWLRSWCGGEWVNKKDIPYEKRPWEIEARAMEGKLTEAFFKVEKTTGISYEGAQ